MTEQFRGNMTIGIGATGGSCTVFAAGAPWGYLTPLSVAGDVTTFKPGYDTYTNGTSMFEQFGTEFRIVSFGIVVRCISSATTAAGIVTLGTSAQIPAVSTTHTVGTELYDEVVIKAIQPGMEISWISQPRGVDARAFTAKSTVTNIVTDWTNCYVEVQGATPSSSPLNVEWYMNIEFNIKKNVNLSSVATKNPPKSVHAETAVSNVHSNVGSFIEGGVRQVEDIVMRYASTALDTAIRNPMGALEGLASLFI